MQTISKVDKKLIEEIKDYLVNPKTKKKLFTWTALCLAGTVVSVLLKNMYLAIIFGVVTIALGQNLLTLKKKAIKTVLKSIEKEDYSYIINFGENIHIKNVTTGLESNIPAYEAEFLLEKEEYFVIFTRKWQFIPVYKEKLENVETFVEYLKEQAPCMKIGGKYELRTLS